MELFVLWIAFSFIAAAIASSKGRGAGGPFLLSLILSPLVGIAVAIVMKPDQQVLEAREVKSGNKKTCPFCAETIKADAVVCRYCGRDLPDSPSPEPPPELSRNPTKPKPAARKTQEIKGSPTLRPPRVPVEESAENLTIGEMKKRGLIK